MCKFVILFFISVFLQEIIGLNNESEKYLDIIVSARTQKLQVIWRNLDVNGTVTIRNGPQNDSDILLQDIIQTTNGILNTEIQYNYTHFKNLITIKTACYGFYAFYDKNEISTCIRAYPKWMRNMKSSIGHLKFRELFIPGSHNSGAYKNDFDPTKPDEFKYVLCQDEDIRGQLMAGVRYFDIRPGYYPIDTIKFWINHSVYKLQRMDLVLKEIYNFVKETNEIVIIDFHYFEIGFTSFEIHKEFVEFVNATIGDQVVISPSGWDVTLNEIWNNSERIIIGYNEDPVMTKFYPFLLPGIKQRWANVDKVENLKNYLYSVNNDPITSLTPVSDMAQLTPQLIGIIFDIYKGLRTMADHTNPLVSGWYLTDLGNNSNIVSLDFLRGTTVIKYGLKLNRNRTRIVF